MKSGRCGCLALLLAVLAACSPAAGDDRVELVIVNRATEAVLLSVDRARCLDPAAIATLDGRTILIERPRLSVGLRVDRSGACAAAAAALDISLRHLGGGKIGHLALAWDDDDRLTSAATAEAAYNAYVSVARDEGPSGPRLTVAFTPCS